MGVGELTPVGGHRINTEGFNKTIPFMAHCVSELQSNAEAAAARPGGADGPGVAPALPHADAQPEGAVLPQDQRLLQVQDPPQGPAGAEPTALSQRKTSPNVEHRAAHPRRVPHKVAIASALRQTLHLGKLSPDGTASTEDPANFPAGYLTWLIRSRA